MPRKTKKQKLRAHTHTAQLPKKEHVISREIQDQQPSVTLNTANSSKKEQLPLVPPQKKRKITEPVDIEAVAYFKKDVTKTAFLTGLIVVIEVVLYQLMQSGTLANWVPALRI